MKKIPVSEHISEYNSLINDITSEIDKNKREMKSCTTRQLQSFLKRIVALKKQVPNLTKKVVDSEVKDDENVKHNHLQDPQRISPELAFFLRVPEGSLLRRSDVITALCVYCYIKPDEDRENVLKWKYLNENGRDLRDTERKGGRFIPDEILNDLLKFDDYTLKVREGKIFKNVRNKETGIKSLEPVTDESMFIWTISKLVSRHLLK
jgi:hypothetical protein